MIIAIHHAFNIPLSLCFVGEMLKEDSSEGVGELPRASKCMLLPLLFDIRIRCWTISAFFYSRFESVVQIVRGPPLANGIIIPNRRNWNAKTCNLTL